MLPPLSSGYGLSHPLRLYGKLAYGQSTSGSNLLSNDFC
jgi:hypothetical protein